jgi:inner membrane transporter RhtA
MSSTSTSIPQEQKESSEAATLLPPWALVAIAIISVQMGAAVAKQLFDVVGFGGVVFLRTSLGALIFMIAMRARWRGHPSSVYRISLIYGAVIAVNMLAFYAAIDRIPLGIAVAIAFAGPLTISVLGSRRALDIIWIVLAAIGIILLSPITDGNLDPIGVGLAVVCSFAWGAFILVTKRASQLVKDNTIVMLGMAFAALVAAPFGITKSVAVLADPRLIGITIIVAVLSSVIPFWLEFKALRQLPARVFGLLMSLEPVAAAVIGWVVLGEALAVEKIIGIGLITIAAIATTRSSH